MYNKILLSKPDGAEPCWVTFTVVQLLIRRLVNKSIANFD